MIPAAGLPGALERRARRRDRAGRPGAEGIDLLGRVRDVIAEGFRKSTVRLADVRWVVLTGGSSAWPFVKDMLTEDIGIAAERVLASANARRAVGEGIAMLPVYKAQNRTKYSKMRAEKSEVVTEATDAVLERVKEFMGALVAESVSEFFESDLRPVLERYRKEGGRIVELRKELEDRAPAFERTVETKVEGRRAELEAALTRSVGEAFSKWFQARDIEWDPAAAVDLEGLGDLRETGFDKVGFDGVATGLVSFIVAVVAAELLGGGGVALLMSGPIGWFIGLVLGVLAVVYGKSALEKARMPAWAMGLAITPRRIEALQGKTQLAFMQKLTEALEAKRGSIESEVERFAERQIRDLEALDDL